MIKWSVIKIFTQCIKERCVLLFYQIIVFYITNTHYFVGVAVKIRKFPKIKSYQIKSGFSENY